MAKPKTPRAPAHIGKRGKEFWKSVLTDFDLEPHHLDLLQAACEQLDRAESARKEVEKHGVTVLDRFEQHKANPAVELERQAHCTFLRLVRELGLDIETPETRGYRRPGTR